MISVLNSAQAQAATQMSRNFGDVYSGGFAQLLNDILDGLASGSVGIASAAADVDSIALGGGVFTWDQDTTSGLTFAYKAGRLHNGLASVSVGAGTVALSASATNYVEVDRSGTVSANTTSFTSGKMPLYTIVTGSSTISTVTNSKPLLTLVGPAGINGVELSTVAATKSIDKTISTVSATTSFIIIAPCAGVLSKIVFACATAVTANDTNYWTFGCINKGQGGSGTQAVLNTGAVNTTKATGGTSITAKAPLVLTLTTVITTELNVAENDVLEFTITATGSPTTMNECSLRAAFSFTT